MHTPHWRQLAIQCAADPAATVAMPLLAATYVCFFHELSGRAKLDTSENVLIEETRNLSTAMLVAFRQNADWCRSLEH